MSERLIVIGGGGAGTAAATIAKRAEPGPAGHAVHRVRGHRVLAVRDPVRARRARSRKFEDLFLSTVERYVEDGLDMRMETVVTDIDLDRAHGHRAQQARGLRQARHLHRASRGRSPTCPGANLEGLHYVKNIRAAMEFDKQLDAMKRVVVVGATPARRRDGRQPRPPRAEVDFVDEGPWVL